MTNQVPACVLVFCILFLPVAMNDLFGRRRFQPAMVHVEGFIFSLSAAATALINQNREAPLYIHITLNECNQVCALLFYPDFVDHSLLRLVFHMVEI